MVFPCLVTINNFMIIFREVLKDNKDEFISLCVDVSDLVSHFAQNISATFCIYSCTMSPTTTSILSI